MIQDPIVNEVRQAGARLAAEAGNDVRRFFEKLRQAQKDYGKPLVQKPVPRTDRTDEVLPVVKTKNPPV